VQELVINPSIGKVVLIGRRKHELLSEQLDKVEEAIIDFDNIENHSHLFEGFDAGYCCLGTTRSKSGKEGFIKVDYHYVFQSARLAKQGGCKHFHLVSSQGANKDSWFLYPQIKGQVETEVMNLDFERLSIYRPALLLCERKENRPLEKILQGLLGAIDLWSKITIPTKTVAQGMVKNTFTNIDTSLEILENCDILKLSEFEPQSNTRLETDTET